MSEAGAIVLLLFSVFISACSQILLKKSAEKTYPSKLREYLNVPTVLAYGIFFVSAFLTTLAYRFLEVSFATVLENTGYFFVMILSMIFLSEKVTLRKWIAMGLVVAGILIFHMQ
ncbi:MAG: EamA family transporter [Lachnospiraceae bacterium]|nr:EamA family transporter [Lachnospiraceae bacterium]